MRFSWRGNDKVKWSEVQKDAVDIDGQKTNWLCIDAVGLGNFLNTY